MTPPATSTLNLPAEAPPDVTLASRNRLVISLLLVSTFVVILNETLMGVAIPHLMHDLKITASAAQWLTTAFLLTMATVIPVTGYLLQRLNTRPVFILAMVAFSLGTLASALAPGLAWLIVGRIVQAVGTAVMMPLLMTTIMTLVPPESRGKTMGEISIVISVAPAIGPTISGLILSTLTWRWMFWLVLPIALGSLFLGARLISNVTTPTDAPIDLPSVPLAAFGFGGLVYGLSSIGETTRTGGPGWLPVAVGVLALGLFLARQVALQRHDRALLDLRTLASRNFSVSLVTMAICMMSLFGTFILLPIYLQHVLGLDTLKTGLLMLPGGLVMGLLAPPVGRLYDRHGPTRLLVPGTLMVSAVSWWMTTLSEQTPIMGILVAHIVLSIGLALTFTPLFTASLGSLPAKLYSHGSALLGTVQQLAGAIGAALFVALMAKASAAMLSSGVPAIAATAGGIRAAFLCGAILSSFAILAACFVRKPADAGPAH
ncbi:MAG: MDR family MFS transporter [Candidatus Sericytochromatia bacterium]